MAEFKSTLILKDGSGNEVEIDLRNALVLSSAPTTATKARQGMQAYVVAGNKITEEYVCTAVSGSTYTWVKRDNGGGTGSEGDVPLFTNQLDTAGLTTGIRLDLSTGEEKTAEYTSATGFIACKNGDVIRVNDDFQLQNGAGGEDVAYYGVVIYDESKTIIASNKGTTYSAITKNSNWNPVVNGAGYLVQFEMHAGGTPAYIRMVGSNRLTGDNPIVTVNEEIRYGAASVEVDATLTEPGKAADAAATGEALDGKADKGDVYEYVDDAPQFTNMLEADGLTTKIRLDVSTGETLSSDAWTYISTTGYIPCKHGDVIRVNDDFQLDTSGGYYVFVLYDKDKNYKTGANLKSIISNTNAEPILNNAGHLVQFKLCWTGSTAYIRISNHNKIMGTNPVLTVNEEIKYVAGYGTMLNSALKIRQRQIVDAPARNGWSILPYEHIAVAYSSIGRKPINTVEHFTDAAENFGYNALKCDLQPTSDGELVCCHDEGFTFNADGYITTYDSNNQTLIHDVTAAACLGYSFRTGEHPCLVGDYLNVCRKYGKVSFITIRSDYMDVVIPKLLAELKKHNMMYSTIINSMDYNSLVEWRKRDQTVMINYTMYHKLDLTESYIDRAVELGYCSMCNFSLTTTSDRPLNTAALEYAAENGIRVGEAIAYVEGAAEWCFDNGYDLCHIAYPYKPKDGVTV